MRSKLLIITDYNGNFYCHHRDNTMNLKKMVKMFEKDYKIIKIIKFDNLYDNINEIKDWDIIYTSIENAPKYKDMIIDVIKTLSVNNSVYPKLDILLSHDNKIYQEYYKQIVGIESIPSIKINNFLEFIHKNIVFPCVLKRLEGSGSRNVFLVKSKSEVFYYEKKILINNIKNNIIMRNNSLYKIKASLLILLLRFLPSNIGYNIFINRCKSMQLNDCGFLLQKFIPNQQCDYKVLVYGDKYFCIKRSVRKKDFRASGSGIFESFILSESILKQLKYYYERLDTPIVSFDITIDYKSNKMSLIEWQGIHHGTATLCLSKEYCEFKNGKIIKKNNDNPDIERLFVEAYMQYITNRGK